MAKTPEGYWVRLSAFVRAHGVDPDLIPSGEITWDDKPGGTIEYREIIPAEDGTPITHWRTGERLLTLPQSVTVHTPYADFCERP